MEVPSTNKQDNSVTNPHNGYYFYNLLCGVNDMTNREQAQINQETNRQVVKAVNNLKRSLRDKIQGAKTIKDIKDAMLTWCNSTTSTTNYMKGYR